MSGPVIPADKWPEWADRHCWDEDGTGLFYGSVNVVWGWQPELGPSGIPMPASHDWRVPVMRVVAPAIDLGQFREAVGYMIDCSETDAELSHARRLLALIDGQAKCGTCRTAIRPHPLTGTICDCALQPTKGEGVAGD